MHLTNYESVKSELRTAPRTWLLTGVAGFIGSNILEELLRLDQRVVGLDNLSTGSLSNLEDVRSSLRGTQWKRFRFMEGDICDLKVCRRASRNADYILHQAALASVPRSIEDPWTTHAANVSGFVNVLMAGRDAQVKRIVYASSSAVYGDQPKLPNVELDAIQPLSPYAATKAIDEIYAGTFGKCYGLSTIGLRYFNVFGPRQDPTGSYAAVIPKWFLALRDNRAVYIFGNGKASRDFCPVENVVGGNIAAALCPKSGQKVYNIASGQHMSLALLFDRIRTLVAEAHPKAACARPTYRAERKGDIRHSAASIVSAKKMLGYQIVCNVNEGLRTTCKWYMRERFFRQDPTKSQ